MEDFSETHAGSLKKGFKFLVLVSGCLLFALFAISRLNLDLYLARLFYAPGEGFFLSNAWPWGILYRYGTFPGLALTAGAFLFWLVCLLNKNRQGWGRYFLLLALTSAIGCGIVANVILKPWWGRPRPEQILSFGGEWGYHDVWHPGVPGKGESFPCGHATMGFLFVALFFFRRKSRAVAYAGGTFGLFYGALLGATRVVGGAHFLSDVVSSLGIILLTSGALYYLVLKIPETGHEPGPSSARPAASVVILGTAGLVVLFGLLFYRPFFETFRQPLSLSSGVRQLHIESNVRPVKTEIRYEPQGRLRVLIDSFGYRLPNASLEVSDAVRVEGDTLHCVYGLKPKGFFFKANHRITAVVPLSDKGRVSVLFTTGPAGRKE